MDDRGAGGDQQGIAPVVPNHHSEENDPSESESETSSTGDIDDEDCMEGAVLYTSKLRGDVR